MIRWTCSLDRGDSNAYRCLMPNLFENGHPEEQERG
jgi:hypothetical protein